MFRRILIRISVLTVIVACNLAQPQPTLLPTPNIPTVEIIDPPNNVQVIDGTEIVIDVVGRDASIGVSKIELLVDGSNVNNVSPFDNVAAPVFRAQISWVAVGEGFHILEAVAYRPDGQRSDSALINIEVLPESP